MTIAIRLEDGKGSSSQVKVTKDGELITRVFDYSDSNSVTLDVANQAFNLFGPVSDSNFIITGIIISSNKDITVNGSLVQIYEADSPDDLPGTKDRLPINILKNATIPITPLLGKINMGKYLNAKHDDASPNAEVFVTVFGYYIPADVTAVT